MFCVFSVIILSFSNEHLSVLGIAATFKVYVATPCYY